MGSLEKPAFSESPGPAKIVKKWHQLGASFFASLTAFTSGNCFALPAILVPQLEEPDSPILVDAEQGSWVGSIMLLGGIVGALAGSVQSDRLGRRRSLMLDNALFLAAFLCISFAPNLASVLAGRFLCGYATASSQVTLPIYVSEISQPGIRNLTSSLFILCNNWGFGSILLLGAAMPWRIAVGVSCVPSLVALVGLQFVCPETPVWLARNGMDEDFWKSMSFLRGDPEIMRRELANIRAAQTAATSYSPSSNKDKESFSLISSWIDKARQYWRILSRPSFVKPFLLVLAVVPVGVELSGLCVIGFYMVKILKESDLPFSPYWAAAGIAVYRCVISLFCSGIVQRFRRRPVFFINGVIIVLSTFTLGLYAYLKEETTSLTGLAWTNWIPLVAICTFFTGISLGYMTTSFGLQGELLPADARSFGCGLVSLVDYGTSFVLVKSVPALLVFIGTCGLFWLFSSIIAVLLVVLYFALPETHGLSLEEIESMFREKEVLKEEEKEDKVKKSDLFNVL